MTGHFWESETERKKERERERKKITINKMKERKKTQKKERKKERKKQRNKQKKTNNYIWYWNMLPPLHAILHPKLPHPVSFLVSVFCLQGRRNKQVHNLLTGVGPLLLYIIVLHFWLPTDFSLHKLILARTNFCTNKPLTKPSFTPTTFFTNKLCHKLVFTSSNLYAYRVLHKLAFTPAAIAK